jgi:hypothetical protein
VVLSRHSDAHQLRFAVRGENLNVWCRVPGSPFAGTLALVPNPTTLPPVAVTFGPVSLPEDFDTITLFIRSPGGPRHDNTLALETQALDADSQVLATTTTQLAGGALATISLRFAPPADRKVALRLALAFEHYAGGNVYGSIRLPDLLAYESNPLVEMSNRAGTDKGTEPYAGTGWPHCYAIAYHRLFSPFREGEFRMLEIGLETPSAGTGKTTDAPSLRVWREYFPNAAIYGYDINDFDFFEQDRTVIFRGDQSSREDLGRFLAENGEQQFKLVIDDGSHASSHQQISLAALFGHVEPGGLYVVEDLQWQPFPESPKTIDFLQRYIEGHGIDSPWISDDERRYLEEEIASVEILKPNDAEIGVIRKRAG